MKRKTKVEQYTWTGKPELSLDILGKYVCGEMVSCRSPKPLFEVRPLADVQK